MTKGELYLLLGTLSFALLTFLAGIGQLTGHRPVQKDWKGTMATIREASSFSDTEEDRPIHKLVGVFLVLISLVAAVLYFVPATRGIAFSALCGGASLFMFLHAFYLGVLLPVRCTQRVFAEYIGYRSIPRFRFFGFPQFSFEWDGKRYFSTAFLNFHRDKTFVRQYWQIRKYPVFINPHDPYEICTGRLGATPILCVLLGLLLLGASLASLLYLP